MASIVRDANGRKRILYFNADGKRKPLRIGVATMSYAREVATNVDLLIAAKRNGAMPEPKAVDWLASIGDDLHKKLAEHGIVSPRTKAGQVALAVFLDSYIGKRSDVKGGTAVVYGHTRRCLVEYFGADKPLAEITPADADDWRRWLGLAKNEDDPTAGGQGLSDNTIRRRCGIARQFFRDAVRRRLIAESPFAEMQGVVVRSNRSRDYFVSRKHADAVLKACPDSQWKLLFALSRYGGLRCPSEHLVLTWGDVDFDAGRIRIRSPKTEHHEGKGERVMPLFPELRPHLEAVRNELENDPDFDPKSRPTSKLPVITRYRDANANLRTQLIKIIRRAGLKPWPKLFQNLRATRATELADEYPTHVAADWLGHSTTIADKHYRQTTEAHFAKAVGIDPESAAQKAAQLSAETGTQGNVIETNHTLFPPITSNDDTLLYCKWATLDSNQ